MKLAEASSFFIIYLLLYIIIYLLPDFFSLADDYNRIGLLIVLHVYIPLVQCK